MEKILNRTIKAVSKSRLDMGQIGFMTTQEDEDGKWFNVTGEIPALEYILKNIICKGNIIEFEYDNNIVGSLKLIQKGEAKKSGFDDSTNFEELLDSAHKKFPNRLSIKTEMVEPIDYENKRALFNASVSIETWEKNEDNFLERKIQVYTAHGDAEGITNDTIKPHFIRMAETRAIARALRWATNNAKVSDEETSGEKNE